MSKDLFSLMRQQEIEIQLSARTFVKDLLDAGETDKYELLAQAKRMSEALEVINSELLKVLPQENFEAFGMKGTFRSGGETINYTDDAIYCQLKADLDARAELLKLALKQDVIDAYGNEVPKVSTTPRKSSLAISF